MPKHTVLFIAELDLLLNLYHFLERIMQSVIYKTGIKSSLFSLILMLSMSVFALDHNDGKQLYEDITAVEIPNITPSKTILGQDFKYPAGVPLIKAYNIEIPPGKQTTLHKHAVPLYAYIVSGDLEVDYGSKGKRVFKAGTSYVEAINWCHLGKTIGNQPVKVIGIYLAQVNPDQVKPETCAKPD